LFHYKEICYDARSHEHKTHDSPCRCDLFWNEVYIFLNVQQVRGTRGEHTEAEGGVYDISNKRRMGLTEYEAVKEMYDGIAELIKLESAL